jgi:MarR family transcriptional regulator, 2-MHQ and catechol-resistance regulon repressor
MWSDVVSAAMRLAERRCVTYLSTKMKTPSPSARAAKRGAAPAPVDRKQETALKLWVVLARASAAVTKHMEADIARYDLTGTEFGILEALYHKGPMLLGEIQRKILVTSGGITYLVDRLVEKGLVRREQSEEDRRARYAVLTPAGHALIKRIFPAHAARIEQALSGLTTAEQREATQLLRRLGLAAAAELGETLE